MGAHLFGSPCTRGLQPSY